MELTKNSVFNILKNKTYFTDKNKLITFINDTKNKYYDYLDILFNETITGLNYASDCNPLLWEAYHPIWFIKKMCLSYFIEIDLKEENKIYDSLICKSKYRVCSELYNILIIKKYSDFCFKELLKIDINPTNYYLITLSLVHLHMHLESYLFTRKKLYIEKHNFSIKNDNHIILDLKFKKIQGGKFIQGNNNKNSPIVFDNEIPCFKNQVNNFSISETVVTNLIYYNFIKDKGYQNKNFWSTYGWKYIQENNIILPLYWEINDNITIKIYFNDQWVNLLDIGNHPICHISWWEAEAFCNWYKGRLPTESEWEYLASKCNKENSNINYKNGIVSVNDFNNDDPVQQIYGNVWEWCQEAIYPYDGFIIDPVYREFSYPFFGFKKICRGGSWATPSQLVHKAYRNSQLPECRHQFISFRVCKD